MFSNRAIVLVQQVGQRNVSEKILGMRIKAITSIYKITKAMCILANKREKLWAGCDEHLVLKLYDMLFSWVCYIRAFAGFHGGAIDGDFEWGVYDG